MKFYIYTFGCKVNSYESESLRERLIALGYIEAKNPDESDYIFINTCAVTNEAEKKDLQKTRSVSRKYPNAKIVIMGCSSQLHKDKYLSIPSVVTVIGNSLKNKVECLLEGEEKDYVNLDSRHFVYEDTPIIEGEKNVRGYIKIQDGCNNFCSYCVVPFTRGNSRSRNKDSILKECKDLIHHGIKEIIVGGIDTGSYIDPEDSAYNLTSLLKDMLTLSSSHYRIRVSSIEASQVDDEYIELFKQHRDRLCPHFHLPLQSGCEKTLLRMNRKYSLSNFEALVNKIRKEIPDVALSTDVICGFPGENEQDFSDTYNFCKRIGFMRIHAFPYSERPFTMAASLKDVVPMHVRMERVKRLMTLSDENDSLFRKQLKGKEVSVLIEEKNKEGFYCGYSENYLRFAIESSQDIVSLFYSKKID